MKKTLTKAPIVPDGWQPRPNEAHHSFLDWNTRFFYWQCWIRKIPTPYSEFNQIGNVKN